jgi:DNA-binding response OmpR family regulator
MKSVLVIDRNPLALELLSALLQQEGYAVRAARDAATALAVLRETSVDLVLLDAAVPGVDGTLPAALLDHSACDARPVVLLTSFRPLDALALVRAGAAGVVAKPFEPTELLAQVACALGK